MAVNGELHSSLDTQIYDADAFDSMAVINSELWNQSQEDEKELMTVDKVFLQEGTLEDLGPVFLKAAQTGNLDIVKGIFGRFKGVISFEDEDGYTALHRASYNGHVSTAEFLLQCGANVMNKTKLGWTPLHSACRWNKVEVASLLLQNGADINAGTDGDHTPLHLAATNEHAKNTLELLLRHRDIDPELKNCNGDTGYDLAVRHGPLSYLFELVDESLTVN